MKPLPAEIAALRAGGKPALARTLAALETCAEDERLAALLDAAFREPGGAVVGLTGPPGVGKSTLVSTLVARLRSTGRSVGIIAVDPSSRRSRGALLGDRTRIATDPEDPGVFVRSMAARDRLGGLADLSYPASVLMRALFDLVIIETVGVGQSETDVTDCTDLVVFCAQPGSGDALQFMKAGIMEIPDVVLVTKGDLGAPATRAAADIAGALSLAAGQGRSVPVLVVSSRTGDGIDAAIDRIDAVAGAHGDRAARRAGQARLWAEARLRDAFGSEGITLVGRDSDPDGPPFADLSRRRARARALLQAAVESR